MLGFLFLIMDLSWAIFARSVLQYAVREGVRYAVTSQTVAGLGHVDSIKTVVQNHALGLLNGDGWDKIQVRFYSPDTFEDVTALPGANAGGNLVEVSVQGYSWLPLFPLLKSNAPLIFSAKSADRMETSPATGPPAM